MGRRSNVVGDAHTRSRREEGLSLLQLD